MSDTPLPPQFIEDEAMLVAPRPVRGVRRPQAATSPAGARARLGWWAGLDLPLIGVVALLLTIGLLMVYSTTFDWSYQTRGSESAIFLRHALNMGIALAACAVAVLLDYRVWRRLALWMLLATIGALCAVLLFGDDTFGARRALIGGSLQPGELAQLVMVLYLAAWLGARKTRVQSIAYGLAPFATLLAIIGGLVILQPDLSTAAIISVTGALMYFLAGARISHMVAAALLVALGGWFMTQQLGYARERLDTYFASARDITQATYHVQQAVIAFVNGGWTGVGLGEGRQKFGYLPAPHTDSIFAVIGEELGVAGAGFVVLLYVALVIRGFGIARRAPDAFGALLASGVTVWVVSQALLNIAVMTAVFPPTGVPLPFVSYGGSSLTVLLTGVGLMLSVSRVSARQTSVPERRSRASADRRRGDGRARLPGARPHRGANLAGPRRRAALRRQ